MRALKVLVVLVKLVTLFQFANIYYGSWQFNSFVQEQTKRIYSSEQLKQALLNEAKFYSLPITDSDINFNTSSSVLRVSVDYRVPVNLIVYQPKLQFHVLSAGIVRQ